MTASAVCDLLTGSSLLRSVAVDLPDLCLFLYRLGRELAHPPARSRNDVGEITQQWTDGEEGYSDMLLVGGRSDGVTGVMHIEDAAVGRSDPLLASVSEVSSEGLDTMFWSDLGVARETAVPGAAALNAERQGPDVISFSSAIFDEDCYLGDSAVDMIRATVVSGD